MQLDEHETRSGPEIPVAEAASEPRGAGLASLRARLRRDKLVRLSLDFMRWFPDAHLKFLVVDAMDDPRRITIGRRQVWNFGSDSFLGLDRHPRVQEAVAEALPRWGTHNGASRAFSSPVLNEEAERKLARWLQVPDTLLFPSVTLANAGLLPAVAGPGTLLLVDRFAHDSVQQGAKLAAAHGADLRTVHLARPDRLRALLAGARPEDCIVATDGLYSMTGAQPPLGELDRIARQFGAILYVDDAHGSGVVGPSGRGAACAALGKLDDIVLVGSLSKAFSCLGAFVTCDPDLKMMMKIRSGPFVFGGPIPPPYLAGLLAATDIVASEEGDALRARLRALVGKLRRGVRELGLTLTGDGESPIVSILVGDMEDVLEVGKWLFDRGLYVQSAHYPAVPMRRSCLRILVNANHPAEAIDALLNALAELRHVLPHDPVFGSASTNPD